MEDYTAELTRRIRAAGACYGELTGGDLPPVDTVYIGGGTPTLLPPDSARTLMEAVHESFTVLPDAEITVKPFELFKKEIVLKASFINPYTQKRALSLIEEGKIDVTSMVYQTIPVEQLPVVLADKKARSAGKYIVTF
jgi:threonine dehydrogenase-like Zn-dependent dehydrogenase